LKLSSTIPTREGYNFIGWNTKQNATTAQYYPQNNYTENADEILYAVWSINNCTISYDMNGGNGSIPEQVKTYGKDLTLSSTIPQKSGYTFIGWNTDKNATTVQYQSGGKYTANVNAVLYAVWIPQLVNKSTVSSTLITSGSTVLVTGLATGGTGEYTYKFYYKKDSSNSWTPFVSSALTETTAKFKPNSVGKFIIRVDTNDDTTSVTKEFMITVNSALVNESFVSPTLITSESSVLIIGSATGGSGFYMYEFYYKKQGDDKWLKFDSSCTTSTTATLQAFSTDTFIVRTYVKDSEGQSACKDITITFTNPLANNTTVTSTNPTTGTAVTINGSATGGTGTYTYQFYYKRKGADSWSKFGSSYQTANTATLKTSSAGTFIVRTYAKDGKSSVVKDFTITFTAPLTNKTTVTTTTPKVGTVVKINGSATGGTGTYTYEFYYKRQGASSWSTFGANYKTDTTATLRASSAGSFDVRVYVKDSSGKTSVKNFVITYSK